MKCVSFEGRLHDILDRREDPSLDRELVTHAQTCEECARYLASQQALFQSLKKVSSFDLKLLSLTPFDLWVGPDNLPPLRR